MEAKEHLAQFKVQTKLTVDLDHYLQHADYLFNEESTRPEQLIETDVIFVSDTEVTFTLTFSEAVQGDNINLDFSGVNATNADDVKVEGHQIIISTKLDNKILPAVTITGVQDKNGNAIELSNIPLTYWSKN